MEEKKEGIKPHHGRTEYTRPIYYGEDRAWCQLKKTKVASDECFKMCPHCLRHRYDPNRPSLTIECEMWPCMLDQATGVVERRKV
jgi:hypothetical protein